MNLRQFNSKYFLNLKSFLKLIDKPIWSVFIYSYTKDIYIIYKLSLDKHLDFFCTRKGNLETRLMLLLANRECTTVNLSMIVSGNPSPTLNSLGQSVGPSACLYQSSEGSLDVSNESEKCQAVSGLAPSFLWNLGKLPQNLMLC